MGVDRALADAVRDGGPPVLRLYRWAPRCLSLGRNQPAAGRYDLEMLRARGIDVVRRPTGGRAVLHDRELTYSVVLRPGVLGAPRETYAAVNRALVAGLRLLGVPAALQPRSSTAARPSLVPCFDEPAEGEVVVAGRKLVGSAQVREGGVLLQHGSLLLDGAQEEVRELLVGGAAARQEAERAVTLAEVLGSAPGWAELSAALRRGWTDALGATLVERGLDDAEAAAAERHAEAFSQVAWTWRC